MHRPAKIQANKEGALSDPFLDQTHDLSDLRQLSVLVIETLALSFAEELSTLELQLRHVRDGDPCVVGSEVGQRVDYVPYALS